MTTGERIRRRRIECGLSVEELAELLEKNRATIYRYESDAIENMPAKVLTPLAEHLNTTPAYLMGWTDDPYDYDNDPNNLLSLIPSAWLKAWREEGISNAEIWQRYSSMQDEPFEGNKKSPDTLADVEGLSEDKRKLFEYIMILTDGEAQKLRVFAEFVLSQRG